MAPATPSCMSAWSSAAATAVYRRARRSKCAPARDQKGPQVTEITSLDASTASREPPRRPQPERPAYPSGDRAAVEQLGTVKWYNANKGFGFIAPDQGGKDIFVHASALERAGIMGLADGQRVAIDVAQGQKGPEAVGLRLI